MPLNELQLRLLEKKRNLSSNFQLFSPEKQTWRNWHQTFNTFIEIMGIGLMGETGQLEELINITKCVTASTMQGTVIERNRPFLS